MAYSAGFSPHPKISYANSAATGVASEAEYVELGVSQECDPEAVRLALDAALPAGLDATALLPEAVAAGVAYVPGAAFYSAQARAHTLRLSFVTVDVARIEEGVRLLGGVLGRALDGQVGAVRAG